MATHTDCTSCLLHLLNNFFDDQIRLNDNPICIQCTTLLNGLNSVGDNTIRGRQIRILSQSINNEIKLSKCFLIIDHPDGIHSTIKFRLVSNNTFTASRQVLKINVLPHSQTNIGILNQQNQFRENINQLNNRIENGNNAANNALQSLIEEQQLQTLTFKGKIPSTQIEFFKYLSKLHNFTTTNIHISEKRLYRKILESLSIAEIELYNNYCTTQFRKDHHDEFSGSSEIEIKNMRTKYNEDHYNTNQLILFCISHIDINPNITNLIAQLKKLRYQKNQHPIAVFESFQRCINHIEVITRILNPHLDENNVLREITPVEITEIFKSIIIDNNDNPKYNNNSKLNSKVKNKMAKRYAQKQNLKIEEIPDILKDIAVDILPKGSYDYSDPNKHWKRYQPIQNLFSLSTEYKNNKIKSVSSSSTVKYNKKCPYGNKCFGFLNNKKCPNYHTKSEIAFMNSKYTRDVKIPKFKSNFYPNKKRKFGNKFNKFNKRGGKFNKFNKFKRFKKFTPFNKYKPGKQKTNNYNINLNKCPMARHVLHGNLVNVKIIINFICNAAIVK